jgi:DNA polymerase III subunit epsilon
MKFCAIDFETADKGADSACSVGLVRVEDGRVVETAVQLLRPFRFDGGDLFSPMPAQFEFTRIHKITPAMVADQPTFAEAWPKLSRLVEGVDFLAAHNAPFDSGVLAACCAAARLPVPKQRFVCTVRLARATWSIYPTKLSDVCAKLSIPLNHHEALSDASACARIVIEAHKKGAPVR